MNISVHLPFDLKWVQNITSLSASDILSHSIDLLEHYTNYQREQISRILANLDPNQDVDLTQYILTKPIMIEGVTYLIDQNRVIYTEHSPHLIVGYRNDPSRPDIQWFNKSS